MSYQVRNLLPVEHTFSLVLPSENKESTRPTGLSQILALVKRSDSVPVKSEGTRVVVNVIKSLWANGPVNVDTADPALSNGKLNKEDVEERQQRKQAAMQTVLTPECAFALASLVARSGKYPLLVNEGVVALSLLSTHNAGGKCHLLHLCHDMLTIW